MSRLLTQALLLRPVGAQARNEAPAWLNQLATMYLRWAKRKGYDAEVVVLEPIPESERRAVDRWEWAEWYPYTWRLLAGDDPDALIRQVEDLPRAAELAIVLAGTNVYGFLKGESGVHRRNEQRTSGERTQHLAQVSVVAPGETSGITWLWDLLEQRAEAERELAGRKGKKPAAKPAAPDVVRVYQLEGQRHARDLRTKVRNNDLAAVLQGDLDDFILAYLRETEAETAWDEQRG